jgi:hypothetical protein
MKLAGIPLIEKERIMKDKLQWLAVGLSVFMLVLSGCGAPLAPEPTPTAPVPSPTATPIDMPEITIADTVFWLTAVREVEESMGREAKPGYRLLEVGFQTDTGTLAQIGEITKDFSVSLSDQAGNHYPAMIHGTGAFCPGTGSLQVCWTFVVPEIEKALWFNLPDGTSIELEAYIP